MMKTLIQIFAVLLLTLLMVSCQSENTAAPLSIFSGEALTPYATITLTATNTVTPQNAPTATLAPTMTPTPRTYQVKDKDTLFVIAFKNGITVDELTAANPTVDPYLLSAGMTLLIPAPNGETDTQTAPTPTPYPLMVYTPVCTPSLSGGLYCFVEIKNEQEVSLENITAGFRLTDLESGEVITQKALMPLSRIVSGTTLPLFTYFPPNTFSNPSAVLQLQTAMSVNQNNVGAATVQIDQPEIKIAENGLSAEVHALAVLESPDGKASKLWIAAVAFDAQGQIVGVRRYESANAVQPGDAVPLSLNIYSIRGTIVRVDLYGEAIP